VTKALGPLTLCYHAVSAGWEHGLSLAPATFERQLRALLRAGFRPATAAEVARGRGRLLHVTFDDAYRSIAPALDALERLGIPASVYACSAHADRGGAPLSVPELEAQPQDELATMDWDALRSLARRGFEVGSHTVSHPRLTHLADEALRRELEVSKERIETELGRPCPLLAYPYGDDDARVHAAARAAGYELAFALPGKARPRDPLALPRVGVYRKDSLPRLGAKVLARPGS
jgi:peptidoglycan/xylan/chitin deacetylase (PgdA/CDA1 family)